MSQQNQFYHICIFQLFLYSGWSQIVPAFYEINRQALSENGSSATGHCSNVSDSGRVCNTPCTSVLFDGIPTLPGLDGDMWASQLLILDTSTSTAKITFDFSTTSNVNEGGAINKVQSVELVMLNCPSTGAGPNIIRVVKDNILLTTIYIPQSCEYLYRGCVDMISHAEQKLTMEFLNRSPRQYIAEISFYGNSNFDCPNKGPILESVVTSIVTASTMPEDTSKDANISKLTSDTIPMSRTISNSLITNGSKFMRTTTKPLNETFKKYSNSSNDIVIPSIVIAVFIIILLVLSILLILFIKTQKTKKMRMQRTHLELTEQTSVAHVPHKDNLVLSSHVASIDDIVIADYGRIESDTKNNVTLDTKGDAFDYCTVTETQLNNFGSLLNHSNSANSINDMDIAGYSTVDLENKKSKKLSSTSFPSKTKTDLSEYAIVDQSDNNGHIITVHAGKHNHSQMEHLYSKVDKTRPPSLPPSYELSAENNEDNILERLYPMVNQPRKLSLTSSSEITEGLGEKANNIPDDLLSDK